MCSQSGFSTETRYLLEAASKTQLHWDNNQIKVLRARLGCQILALDLQLDSFFEASPRHTTGQVPPQGSEYVSVTMHAPVKRRLSKTPTPISSPEQSRIQASSQHSPLAKFTSKQRVKKIKVAPPPFELRIPGLGYTKSSLTKAQARANELLKWIPQEENDEPDGAMCPFCDEIIPEYLQEEFDSEVQPYIKLSQQFARASNPEGRTAKKGKTIQIATFCHWHRTKVQTAEMQSARQKWPQTISSKELPQRIQQLIPHIKQVLQEPTKSFAYGPALQLWKEKGRKFCITTKGMFVASQLSGLAYYGDAGAEIIFGELMKAQEDEDWTIVWESWEGINEYSYILQNILVPEVVCRLVMADLGIDASEAVVVMEESKQFGQIGNTVVS
ncbi:hypothetical protein FRC09_008790 [Ceratobasidium sp. 395]|nr:hypothetical protein FRC09_008790 [Ceratobasidium sp. 395]